MSNGETIVPCLKCLKIKSQVYKAGQMRIFEDLPTLADSEHLLYPSKK